LFTREVFECVDLHTAGGPLRLILSGYPPLPAGGLLEKRRYLEERLDDYRRLLLSEPWGRDGMVGCLLAEAERQGSTAGLIFMDEGGYLRMCGHGAIAVATYLVDSGRVRAGEDGVATLTFDVPSGHVTARAFWDGQRVSEVALEISPAFAEAIGREIPVRGRRLSMDIGYGGAFFAIVRAGDVTASVELSQLDALRAWVPDIRRAVEDSGLARHPVDRDLDGLSGVIFTAPAHERGHHSRNVTIYGDGQIDRSPTGTGLAARLAVLAQTEGLSAGRPIVVESLIDTTFSGELLGEGEPLGHVGTIRAAVTGSAHVTGFRRFFHDPADPIPPFTIR